MKDGFGMDHPRSGDWDGRTRRVPKDELLEKIEGALARVRQLHGRCDYEACPICFDNTQIAQTGLENVKE